MFGFVINAVAVIVGSIIGLLFRKLFKKEYCDSVLKVMGVVIFLVGICGVIENMITIDNGKVSFEGTLLLILSLAIGSFIGEFIKIEHHLNNIGLKLETKLKKGNISEGFITASIIYCVGAMTIVGSLNDTLGKPEMIYLKSCLDGITSIVLASTIGFGVLFSFIPVLVIQGSLTLVFSFLQNILVSEELLRSIGMVGYAVVCAIGINFLLSKKDNNSTEKIKVANMLPSLIIPIIYFLVKIWLG